MTNDPIQAFKKLKRRQADAAEMLWGDGRLRESLSDDQATQLLDWAVRYVKSNLYATVEWPDDEADEYSDGLVMAVRRLLIHINYLITDLPALDETEAEAVVNQFGTALHKLTGHGTFTTQFDLLVSERQTWSKIEVFQRIMNLLTTEPEEE